MIHPDDLFQNMVRRGLTVFQTTIEEVSQVISAGDSALKDLDGALQGRQLAPSETTEQVFTGMLTLMQEMLAEARDKGDVSAGPVIQKAREVLTRINRVEPAWRPGPVSIKTTTDYFRMAMRDLRGSDSLVRLATGQGQPGDLDQLTSWANNINERLGKTAEPESKPRLKSQKQLAAPKPSARKKKSAITTPEIVFAQAVAEELGDKEVNGWAKEFAGGKITEKQWISRLTTHVAAGRDTLDDIFARAEQRIRERNAQQK